MRTFIGNRSMCALIAISVFILISCGLPSTKPPPPSGIRTYVYPDGSELYRTIASVFIDHGLNLVRQIPSRGYFDTAWEYYSGKKMFLFRYSERRKYEVLLTPEIGCNERYVFHFKLFVEEKAASQNSQWHIRAVSTLEDKRYLEILQKIDDAVVNNGGKIL